MEQALPIGKVTCPDCGGTNVAQARFCNHCGAKLDEAGSAPQPPVQPVDPLIGKSIDGRFKVFKLLGEGGMGRVYLAEQTSMGRPVALKVLSPHIGNDERIKDRFRNEASLASRLNHPGTVVIFDFGVTTDHMMFIAMELLEGTSLKDELDECGRMDWRRAAGIVGQICGSLQDAHDKAIIHRDLKPENIMLISRNLERDIVKVLDFGVAKILIDNDWKAKRGITAPNEIFGTPEYMSPEQARGDEMSAATDIYSLGVILFRMLAGQLPFDGPTPLAVLAKHLADVPPPLSKFTADRELPSQLETLVMQCLSKRASDRPAGMDEVRIRLDAMLNYQGARGKRSAAPASVSSAGTAGEEGAAAMQESPSAKRRPRSVPLEHALPPVVSAADENTESKKGGGDRGAGDGEGSGPAADGIPSVSSPAKAPEDSHGAPPAVRGAVPDADSPMAFDEGVPDANLSTREQTLEKLLDRIKSRRDFPAVSRNISELNTKVGLDSTSASQLANVILKDTSLTTRLIKLANSPFYGNTRGRITMVSRAVVLMGFDAVREAALGLLLFDHLQSTDPKRASELQDAAIGALMAGIVAKENAWRIRNLNKEEAFICAMFHNLGRQAAIFYLPAEMEKIRSRVAAGESEERAVTAELGVSFDDLGQELAKMWDFPEQIRDTMHSLPEGTLDKPKSKPEKLRFMAGFAAELTKLASSGDPITSKQLFAEFTARYEAGIKISQDDIKDMVSESLEKMEEYAENMNLQPSKSRIVQEIHHTMGTIRRVSEPPEESPGPAMTQSGRVVRSPDMSDADYDSLLQEIAAEETSRKEQIIKDGIDEVTASMKGRFDLNSLMLMVLETMYRAFGLNRVFFCLYDVRTKTLRARSGFGADVDELMPSFHFSPKGGRDIFTLAMSSGDVQIVPDTRDKKLLGRIPSWYKNIADEPFVMLYPIRLQQFPAALFYGDLTEPNPAFDPALLEQMRMLHEQAAAAIAMTNRKRR